jgi:hypothetical protein
MAKVDPRNHLGLVDNTKLEWLGKLRRDEIILLNSLMQEAEEFADEDLMKFCQRHIRLGTAEKGERAELMAKVAIHDEAKRDVVETRTGAPGGEVPRGP